MFIVFSSPLNSSPLVTALSPLAFLGAKVRKTGPSSRAPSPQGFFRPDSPPRTRLGVRQPAKVVRQPAELVTTDVIHPAPFFVQKALKKVESEESVFLCRTASQMPEPPNSLVFGGKRQTTTLLMSPLVTASSPLSLGPKLTQNAIFGRPQQVQEHERLRRPAVGKSSELQINDSEGFLAFVSWRRSRRTATRPA